MPRPTTSWFCAASYDGNVLDAAAVKALASIPSRDELIAQLLGVMQAPVSGFARLLAALAAKKSEGAPAEGEGAAAAAESEGAAA